MALLSVRSSLAEDGSAMRKSTRLFEIIQILRRSTAPVTAEELARQLETSVRTIYRDIAALQGMRTPIEGEAGVGYVMRRGYDLPPLNFDGEEVEALHVGLSMLARTGDSELQRAACRIISKIEALGEGAEWLLVAPWGAPMDDPARGCTQISLLRMAVRESRKLRLLYRDATDVETERTVRPLALVYHIDCTMLAAWCELRSGFRHFRTDRIWRCDALDATFCDQAEVLRKLWFEENPWGEVASA